MRSRSQVLWVTRTRLLMLVPHRMKTVLVQRLRSLERRCSGDSICRCRVFNHWSWSRRGMNNRDRRFKHIFEVCDNRRWCNIRTLVQERSRHKSRQVPRHQSACRRGPWTCCGYDGWRQPPPFVLPDVRVSKKLEVSCYVSATRSIQQHVRRVQPLPWMSPAWVLAQKVRKQTLASQNTSW